MSYRELPQSAIKILRSTYSEVVLSDRGLNHAQKRKLWKKHKRKKRRIINFFARKFLCDSLPTELDDTENPSDEYDVPKGPLTNSAIISYLKNRHANEHASTALQTGILKNDQSVKDDFSMVCEVSKVSIPRSPCVVQSSEDLPELLDCSNGNRANMTQDDINSGSISVKMTSNCDGDDHTAEEKKEVEDLLAQLDDEVERWQNPPPPDLYEAVRMQEMILLPSQSAALEESEDHRPLCSFFSKMGACRFGDKCSKKHKTVELSNTLLFLNMFHTFLFDLEDRIKVAGDSHDLTLEHSEQDLNEEFAEFYSDVEPEFRSIGRVSHLYVCINRGRHLRGNVYVQYYDIDDAKKCHDKMSGRYFGGKVLRCEYVNIVSWSETLCGINAKYNGKCGRGGQCNYLHVFKPHIPHVRNQSEETRSRKFTQRHRSSKSAHKLSYHRSRSRSRSLSRSGRSDSETFSRRSSRKKRRRYKHSPSRKKRHTKQVTPDLSFQHHIHEPVGKVAKCNVSEIKSWVESHSTSSNSVSHTRPCSKSDYSFAMTDSDNGESIAIKHASKKKKVKKSKTSKKLKKMKKHKSHLPE